MANGTEERTMTDASIVAEPAYDQVLTLSLERCLVDGIAPALVVCPVGITGAAHVLRYRPPDLLAGRRTCPADQHSGRGSHRLVAADRAHPRRRHAPPDPEARRTGALAKIRRRRAWRI